MRGDLKVFAADQEQLEALERRMAELGYLEGRKMGMVFNLLRANDLVWPYIISNYLKGEQPFPFDLLYWNSDSTRMPAANHSYYLRNCYLENRLSKGTMELDGVHLDLHKVTGAGLQSGDARGPHRAGEVGARRLRLLRRPDATCGRGLGPHRRHRQSAGQAEVPVLDRPASPTVDDVDAWLARRPRPGLVVAATGSVDEEDFDRVRSARRASPAPRPASRRPRTRPAAM